MDQILFNDERFGRIVARAAGTFYNPECSANICRIKDSRLLGGLVYTNFTGPAIGVHSASFVPNWVNRDLIYCGFNYPFRQLKVERLFGQVPEDNREALRFNENLGFKVVTIIDGVFPNDVGCVVMKLERSECRFLDIKPRNYFPHRRLNWVPKVEFPKPQTSVH